MDYKKSLITAPNPPSARSERRYFVRTIPTAWLARAAQYRSFAVMVVALELWFRVGVTRCHTVRLDYRSLRVGAGMKPATIRQALWALHESQLVTVTPRGDGRKLEVRVHEVAPAPTGVRRSLPRRAPWRNQDPSEVRDG